MARTGRQTHPVRRIGAVILAAAGTQLPFDRLFDALDRLAHEMQLDIIAQTGDPGRTSDVMQCFDRIAPDRFDELVSKCDVVVGHAGIGVIIAAATHQKPLILMPRHASLGEHRNDHQLATANRFRDRPGVTIVETIEDLAAALRRHTPEPFTFANSAPRESLVAALRGAIVA